MQIGVLNPTFGLIGWTVGVGVVLALLVLALRALLRLSRRDRPGLREAASIEALHLRVDALESELHAFDAGYEQLKARTEFTERLLERHERSDPRTT